MVLQQGEEISPPLSSQLSELLDKTPQSHHCSDHSHTLRHSEQDLQSTPTPTPLSIRSALHGERKDNNSQDLWFIILLTVRK